MQILFCSKCVKLYSGIALVTFQKDIVVGSEMTGKAPGIYKTELEGLVIYIYIHIHSLSRGAAISTDYTCFLP